MRHALIGLALLTAAAGFGRAAAADYDKLTDVRVAMDDGVYMTADVYIPTVADADGDGRYPCVVELTPYRKENRAAEGASYLPAQGIALIEVDARGTGGSGGEYDVVFSVREQADAAAWVEWAALSAQKPPTVDPSNSERRLCEDTVGMYGGSYSGIIQYLVASLPATRTGDVPAAPPHLAAVAPQRAYGDLYRDIVYHGGQVIGSFGEVWATGTTAFYTQPPMDLPGMAATEAWVDHITKNDPMMLNYLSHPYVDATYTSDDSTPAYSQKLYEDSSILPRVGNLRVPTLHLAGFFDAFTRGQLMTFNQAYGLEKAAAPGARGPNFLIAGPWNHSGTHFITPDAGFRAYLSDWYRYWLEGRATGAPAPGWIASGFDGDGARVHYFRTSSGKVNSATPADGAWVDATDWPPPGIDVQNLHLSAGGALTGANLTDLSVDAYASNPTAGTAEILSRWDNAASGSVPMPQWDQRTETGKGLTYQTDVLVDGMRVAGPIGLRLWATVSGIADGVPDDTGLTQLVPPYLDTDFVVKLSDVAPDGTATLVTQGYLRASAIAYDADRSTVLDGEVLAPYHLHTRAALSPPVDGEARAYQIEIWPTAKTFEPGHRIRLDIYSADTPNHLTLLKPTLNEISHGGAFDSYLSLPVLPSP